jgi:hypothetical protein
VPPWALSQLHPREHLLLLTRARHEIVKAFRRPRHERGRCSCFPLNETHSSVSGFGEVEPEFEAASPGT